MAPMIADVPLVAYVAAVFFGLADSSFNTACYAMVSQLYGDEVVMSGFENATIAEEKQALNQQHDCIEDAFNSVEQQAQPLVQLSHYQTSQSTQVVVADVAEKSKNSEEKSSVAFTIFQLVRHNDLL